MDPDANLAEQLRLVANIRKDDDANDDRAAPVPMPFNPSDVRRLCELVEALDGWIANGGFLPRRWRRGKSR